MPEPAAGGAPPSPRSDARPPAIDAASFASIVESALDAVVVMDVGGTIRAWNAQAERTFGWDRGEAIGREVADLIIPGRYRAAHLAGLEKYLTSGTGAVLGQILQLAAVRRGGDEFPIEIAISRVEGLADPTFVAFIRDISERVANQEAIETKRGEEADALHARRAVEAAHARQHAQRMVELERLKTEFMKLASHELRGPLTVIRGYLEMLSDGTIHEAAEPYAVITAKANQMNLLLNQMLEVARLEEGRLQLLLRRVDLRSLVTEALEPLRALTVPGLDLVLEMEDEPVFAVVDANRVRTIVASLVENAIKYSPDGGEVRCRLQRHGDAAVLVVSDHGIGISPEDMPRLFTRFGRIVTPQNSHIDGSGLGLYLCREITLMHGGEVTASSSPLLGTSVTVTLPLAESLEPRGAGGMLYLPAARAGYDLVQPVPSEMIRLGAALQRLGKESENLDTAAAAITGHLYRHLVVRESGERGCALVRFYKTEAYAFLDEERAAFVKRSLQNQSPEQSMRCLTLLASTGDLPEWNDPATSQGHRVIALPSEEALEQLPMVAHLLRQLGADVGQLLFPDPSLILDVAPKTYNVFYVPEAAGSPHVPAQEFVRDHGIRSVLGFGGLLLSGELFAVVMFTRVSVPARTAGMFRLLAQATKQAIEPFTRAGLEA
ncbi:MAG: sensor histidine kinase [Candidatus Dormibacteria bacterium]